MRVVQDNSHNPEDSISFTCQVIKAGWGSKSQPCLRAKRKALDTSKRTRFVKPVFDGLFGYELVKISKNCFNYYEKFINFQ